LTNYYSPLLQDYGHSLRNTDAAYRDIPRTYVFVLYPPVYL
jgi:hypothetical protein